MNVIGKVTVLPRLPKPLERLEELAYNLYWSWTPKAQALYQELDPVNWERFQHNPVQTLLETPAARLEALSSDKDYLARYQEVLEHFDAYMNKGRWGKGEVWAAQNAADLPPVAYFSMEYGFHESLPIYSGGLGVLAGDHCKSASDLGLPFTAVGMLFHQGYFRQLFNKDGWQEEAYDELDLTTLPIRPALTKSGEKAKVSVRVGGRDVTMQLWSLIIGRIQVLLLDANVPENSEDDRKLTARLYGGNQELRIQQYVLLGVGGIRALRALEIPATLYHMNEGHAALMGLERVREYVSQGLDFRTALEATAGSTLFTTHTPVAAGNDAFAYEMMDRYIGEWPALLATSRDELYGLAEHAQNWDGHLVPTFSMTVFALRMSRMANGVSELHGEVSRGMWNFLYPGADPEEVPIGHVTNGAHNLTFLAQQFRDLYSSVLPGDWIERLEDKSMWDDINQIPDAQLAATQHELKEEMIQFVRGKLQEQLRRTGASAADVAAAGEALSAEALTIGFARRFATYKRATLLFRDRERLSKIVNNPAHPVQFIFAGKAHPADNPGKAFIQEIYKLSRDPEFAGKIVILENYDMNVARHLVQGVDIWLNNPRRPLEASGTSGMKASFNGAPNFSVLDGWWREGYDGTNGWPIGEEREYSDLNIQDDADAFSMYETLEHTIVPLYYGKDTEGQNHGWLKTVRRAIITVNPEFAMQRQVIDYVQKFYLPLSQRAEKIDANHFEKARALGGWKSWVRQQWQHVQIHATAQLPATVQPGEEVHVSAQVIPAGIQESDLRVEAVLKHGDETLHVAMKPNGGGEYAASIPLSDSGLYSVGVRVLPYSPDLSNPVELGLMKWA